MAWQTDNGSSAGCFGGQSRRRRVRPFSAGTSHSEMVEIRPNRVLRIVHFNVQPRDPQFEKEMQIQKQYKNHGTIAGGPLTMPKQRQMNEIKSAEETLASHAMPNSIKAGPESCFVNSSSNKKDNIASMTGIRVNFGNTPNSITSIPDQHAGRPNDENLNKSPNHISTVQSHQLSHHFPEQVVSNGKVHADESSDVTLGYKTNNSSGSVSSQAHPETPAGTAVPNNILDKTRRPFTMLFFIHGVGGSSDIWHAQLRYFASLGYEIVAPDLIGHGMSCAPKQAKAYRFKEILADMEEMFDRYCKKRNIVVGHSYGCSFAAILARIRSRRVHKLVLISGGAPTPLAPQPGIFSFPTCMLYCFRPCLNCCFHKSAFHADRNPVLDKEDAFAIPTYVLQHTMNGQDWPDGDEVFHQWLLCPVLLLYGAQDKLVSLKEEQHMAETIFRSRLEVIPDASHMVMVEAPDEVNALLLHFITEDSALPSPSSMPHSETSQHQHYPQQQPPHELPSRSSSRMSTKSYKALPSGQLL